MRTLVAGTRGSQLALWQTRHVMAQLQQKLPGAFGLTEHIIETRGDRDQRERLQGQLEKGFFTEELEAALREKSIDFAVHSLKDLPTKNAEGLVLGAVLPRENPCDWLLVRREFVQARGPGLLPLKAGARIGTSSLRRQSMLGRYAPGCAALPLRGNVPTRVEKLRDGKYEAIVLAAAGVRRLGIDLSAFAVFELPARGWPSAPGQGAVAVQCRADDAELRAWLLRLHDEATATAVTRERQWLTEIEGGCTTPFGCYIVGPHAHLGVDVGGQWRHHRLLDAHFATPALMRAELDRLTKPDAFTEESTHDEEHRALAQAV